MVVDFSYRLLFYEYCSKYSSYRFEKKVKGSKDSFMTFNRKIFIQVSNNIKSIQKFYQDLFYQRYLIKFIGRGKRKKL